MSLATALVAIKSGNTALNALIGTRFNPDVLPQNVTLPAVTFQKISHPRGYSFAGVPTVAHPRVQVDGYAATSTARSALAVALRAAFNRYQGTIGSETVLDIRIENEFDGIDQLDTETEAYRVTMDLIVDIRE